VGSDALTALSPLLATAVNVVVQVVVLRASGGVRFRASLLTGFLAGGLALAALLWTVSCGACARDLAGHALLAGGAYAGLGFCYFAFLNLNQASLRIRMLKELHAAPGETLPLGDLLARYHAGHILDERLDRLLGSGQLVLRADRYYSGPRSEFLVLARFLNLLKRMLLGRSGAPPHGM